MPNHVHGIIVINNLEMPKLEHNVETPNLGVYNEETFNSETPLPNREKTMAASQKWNPESLGVIINQFKRIVTINARKIHADFAWQTRFYDHIIRNNDSYNIIKQYIINNPAKWMEDKFYKNE